MQVKTNQQKNLQIFVKIFTTNVDFISHLQQYTSFTYLNSITRQGSTSQTSVFKLHGKCLVFDITTLVIAQHDSFNELDVSFIFN